MERCGGNFEGSRASRRLGASREMHMKVIIVAPYFFPHVGGVEIYTLNIARRLKALGWAVVIVTSRASDGKEAEDVEGMRTYRLSTSFKASNTPIGFGWRREMKRIFKAEHPHVINAHTPVPYMADMAQRASGSIPFILTYHNDLEKDFWPVQIGVKLLHFTLMRATLRRSTGIIATSEYYIHESRYLQEYAPKIDIVPPGVDTSRFNPDVQVCSQLRNRYGGQRIILFVGSLNKNQKYKGLDILIRAFALTHVAFPETKLVVVGSGDGIDEYISLAGDVGIAKAVEFAGHVNHDSLAQYYKLATVFVMPSTSRTEGFGMVYMEASAVGVPVVGSRVGGVPYAIKNNETGLLVEPKDLDSLHKALRAILSNNSLANRLGKAGAVRAKTDFDWALLAGRTSEVLKKYLNSNGT